MILEIAGLALLVAVAAFYLVPLARERKRRWQRVSARILESHLRERGGEGFPEYRVRYAWNGQQYERVVGQRGPHGHPLWESDVRELVVRRMRKAGYTIPIEINPANPSDAYLVDFASLPANLMFWVLGAVFLVFFLVFAFIAFA